MKPKDRKSNTSKPRQGWTKAQMRLFTVRMCVCCRGLFPREVRGRPGRRLRLPDANYQPVLHLGAESL